MRFKSLSDLNRPTPKQVTFSTLPQEILMTDYAKEKAFTINQLVCKIHQESLEWYGFTVATKDQPDVIVDIGLPKNDQNLHEYTTLGPERIAEYQETLPPDLVINGWIHSHGALKHKHFSQTDEENQITVLDFVASRLRRILAKKEISIQNLNLLVKDQFEQKDLEKGSISLITDVAVSEVILMETIYGGFCYSIVIGDEGWHEQEIHYKERGALSAHISIHKKRAELVLLDTGRSLTDVDIISLAEEVEQKIQPTSNPPVELIERM
jgi:hypothetical protein